LRTWRARSSTSSREVPGKIRLKKEGREKTKNEKKGEKKKERREKKT
jgi:hypothetical protein